MISEKLSSAIKCAVASLPQTDASGLSSDSIFPVGTTTLSYTVTDEAGNAVFMDFKITVEDKWQQDQELASQLM
jgi:hypothetical protein